MTIKPAMKKIASVERPRSLCKLHLTLQSVESRPASTIRASHDESEHVTVSYDSDAEFLGAAIAISAVPCYDRRHTMGVAMTCAWKAVLLLSIGIGFAAAEATALANDDVRLRRLFSVMDLDGSHEISRSEFRSGKSVVLLTIDINGNMTLEPDEMRMSPDGFKLLAGKDGVVDGEEFVESEIGSFDAVDRDKDDQIDYAELSEYIAKYSR